MAEAAVRGHVMGPDDFHDGRFLFLAALRALNNYGNCAPSDARAGASAMNVQVVADRLYGAILLLTAAGLALGGGLLLYWGAAGLPPDLARAMEAHAGDVKLMLGLRVLGWSCLVLSALNVVFSVFAFRGYIWPVIANTVGWSVLLVPTLGQPTVVAVAILVTLIGLTALAVGSRYRNPAPAD